MKSERERRDVTRVQHAHIFFALDRRRGGHALGLVTHTGMVLDLLVGALEPAPTAFSHITHTHLVMVGVVLVLAGPGTLRTRDIRVHELLIVHLGQTRRGMVLTADHAPSLVVIMIKTVRAPIADGVHTAAGSRLRMVWIDGVVADDAFQHGHIGRNPITDRHGAANQISLLCWGETKCRQRKMRTVYNARNTHLHTIFCLHELCGTTPENTFHHTIENRDDNTKIVLLHAPQRKNPAIGLPMMVPSWFNYASDNSGQNVRDKFNKTHLRQQIVRILEEIAQEEPSVNIGIMGYSQGGCLAIEVVKNWEYNQTPLWFCHASRCINLTDDTYNFLTPVLVTLGTEDEIFPFQFSKKTFGNTNAAVVGFEMNHYMEHVGEDEFVMDWYMGLPARK